MSKHLRGHPLPTPTAETFSVERLLESVMSGKIRIPRYQRSFQWNVSHVLALFDSVFRGYPVGALLFHRRKASAATFSMGPLKIEAGEESAALEIVDGQQRIISLTAALKRPLPLPPSDGKDPWVIYFNADDETFIAPKVNEAIADTWVPLPALGDGSDLLEWLFSWHHRDDARLRTNVLNASTRIREYKLPAYIVESASSEILREIFYRINKSGKPLAWKDVHNALYGRTDEAEPTNLEELADALTPLRFGKPDQALLLRCLVGWSGKDPTRTLAEHEDRAPGFLDGATVNALPSLRRTLEFLRRHALIPHLRLLPGTAVLPALVRFFEIFPDPSPRNLVLLRRVVWRFLMSDLDHRSFPRQGVRVINGAKSENQALQALLKLMPLEGRKASLAATFDARAAESRLAILALWSLKPRDLVSAQLVDVPELLEAQQETFRPILGPSQQSSLSLSPANRILLSGAGLARRDLLAKPLSPEVLASHALSDDAISALKQGDKDRFLMLRHQALAQALEALTDRLAEWSASDRPSIAALLEEDE